MVLQIIEIKWYLAFQDGPADNEEYNTEAQAKAALKKVSPSLRRSMCIMSRTYNRSTM